MNYNKSLLLIFLFLISCHKQEPADPCGSHDTHYISSPDLLNCGYKPGSYWVFIDSVTGVFDSLYLDKFEIGQMGRCDYYQYYSYSLISYPSLNGTNYTLSYAGLYKNNGSAIVPFFSTLIFDDYYKQPDSYDYQVSTHLDSFFIYDRYYKKVDQMMFNKDPTEHNNKSSYYINSEYGFLRHDIIDSNNVILSKKLLARKYIIR